MKISLLIGNFRLFRFQQEIFSLWYLKFSYLIPARRLEFERRRKAHYKEFEAVKLARKLIEEELADDDDDEDDANATTEKTKQSTAEAEDQTQERDSQSSSNVRQMDVDAEKI